MLKSKRLNLIITLFLTAIICFLIPAGLNNNAVADNTVELSIAGQNLSLKDNIHIKYAVSTQGVSDNDTLNLLIWKDAQEDYIKGTEDSSLITTDKVEKDDKTLKVFEYKNLSAKQMTDKVYARAYAVVGGIEYYSEVKPYSILEYAYNMLDKTEATPSDDAKLLAVVNSMLEFGGATQVFNNYALDRLANDDFAYVRFENATFADGFNYGIYKVGTTQIITPNEGYFLADDHADYLSVNENEEIILTVPEEKTIDTTSFVENKYSEGLAYSLNDDKASYSVTGLGECTDTDIIIPATYEGLPVTGICDSAFKDKIALTSVIISNSVVNVGSYAFSYCTALRTVVLSENLYQINNGVFNECVSLLNIALPKTVSSIGERAFRNCSSLTSIFIPENVNSIGSSAFEYCYKLVEVINKSQSIKVSPGVFSNGYLGKYALSVSNCDDTYVSKVSVDEFGYVMYIDEEGKMLLNYIGKEEKLNLPNSIAKIYDYAFYMNTQITNVVMPNSIIYIGKYAFWGCESLIDVTLSQNVTTINDETFRNCVKLRSVTLGNNVTHIGKYAFSGCCSLTSIVIPREVNIIDSGAFYACYKLIEVVNESHYITITKGNQENGYVGFYALDVFNSGDVYESNLVIDNEGYIIYFGEQGILLIGYCGSKTKLILPQEITEIYQYAFYKQSLLENVEIAYQVHTIGANAFSGCTSLQSIILPISVNTIGAYAFGGWNNNQTIYCGAKKQLNGWNNNWCSNFVKVVWGYTGEN